MPSTRSKRYHVTQLRKIHAGVQLWYLHHGSVANVVDRRVVAKREESRTVEGHVPRVVDCSGFILVSKCHGHRSVISATNEHVGEAGEHAWIARGVESDIYRLIKGDTQHATLERILDGTLVI